MNWTIAEARRKLSELLERASQEPQTICNRSQPVAVVMDVATYEQLRDLQKREESGSLMDAFDGLRQILADERYTLNVGKRKDRRNAFAPDAE